MNEPSAVEGQGAVVAVLTRAAVSGVAVGVGVVAERRRCAGDGQRGVLVGGVGCR